MKKTKKTALDMAKTTASVIAGNGLFALAVAAFIMPHGILLGGITGIGIVLNQSFGIDPALLVLAMNVILMITGRFVLGRKFFISTIASSLLFPGWLWVLQRVKGIDTLTDNALLAALFAGVLIGVALGLLMRVGSCSGGTDIVNLILHKFTHIPVAILIYTSDFLIIGFQAIFSKPEQLLLGLVTVVLESLVLDHVMVIGKAQLQVYVISDKYEEIRNAVLNDLAVGVTMNVIETGFFGEKQMAVMCVIHPRKLYDLTELIQSIDDNAFITVTKIKEVRGQGFTKERIYKSREEKE